MDPILRVVLNLKFLGHEAGLGPTQPHNNGVDYYTFMIVPNNPSYDLQGLDMTDPNVVRTNPHLDTMSCVPN